MPVTKKLRLKEFSKVRRIPFSLICKKSQRNVAGKDKEEWMVVITYKRIVLMKSAE